MKLTHAFSRFVVVAFAISVAGISAPAQESKLTARQVPAAVISAFKAAYPTATIKGYAREKENGKVFYEIESTDGGTGRDILYNPDGTVAEIEETIPQSDLPAAALEVVKGKYPKAVITKVERITVRIAQSDRIGYEVIGKQGKKRFALEFDGDGKLKGK